MTDSTYTDITFVCDRSGSMNGAADGTYTKAQRSTDGIADIVKEQKSLPGKVRFSLVEFDTAYDWHARAQEDLHWVCVPRGWTALLDATGRAIVETGERLAAMPEDERPGRVFFVVATDGEENSSKEYRGKDGKARIKAMVTEQTEKYGWDFLFVGVDIDAFADGETIGFSRGSTMSATADSYAVAMASTNSNITRSRVTGTKADYSDKERQDVEDAKNKGSAGKR